jgi:hypothetical protein
MRRIFLLIATVVVMGASAGSALAAGQTLCLGAPGAPVSSPGANGQCKSSQTPVTLATQSEVTALQGQVATLQNDNTTLTSEVSALQTKLSKVSYNPTGLNGKPTLTISGANVQIDSGSGATNGTVNGLGNLFIGNDEHSTCGPDFSTVCTQTGSNNLVFGEDQTFTSYGGLIAGQFNTVSGAFADAFGLRDTASGNYSSVRGGIGNTASGVESAVSGGGSNTASGVDSSVSGGDSNTASERDSSILGGEGQTLSTACGTIPSGASGTC